MRQLTKENHVRAHNRLALFTLWNLVICLRTKNLPLQPPGLFEGLTGTVYECPKYNSFRGSHVHYTMHPGRKNLPEVIGFLALGAVSGLEAAVCL